jgi:oxalate decarboxylase/phosphoglucose isomerase-like protein (cupin superfamily)
MKMISKLLALAIMAGLFIGNGVSYGRTFVVENGKDNVPMIFEKNDLILANVPKIGDKECIGFKAGTFYTTTGNSVAGVKIHKLEIEPNGYVAVHEGPSAGEYICYVITGEGEMGLLDKTGKTVATTKWKPGDVIIFRPSIAKPNSLHYWKNGPGKTEMIGIQQ